MKMIGLAAFAAAAALAAPVRAADGAAPRRERIFFVAGHPDDTEGFAATAFLLRDKYELHVIDLTRGELGLGWPGLWDGSTAARRVSEEKAACAYLGATPHFLCEVDGDACAGRDSVERLVTMIKHFKPVAIFTHWPVDAHTDHVQAAATTAHAIAKSGWTGERYFFEVLMCQTQNFRPLYSVDVTATIDKKVAMLRKYVCQNANDSLAMEKRAQAQLRGAERNPKCAFAELFTSFDGRPVKGGVLEKLPQTVIVK
ncbi:MAG: PIG-L family deacetylase [Kiritimatiellae bacterium]|nr:PIG-L family deacetylase [Kiritimatiellia bacterium]